MSRTSQITEPSAQPTQAMTYRDITITAVQADDGAAVVWIDTTDEPTPQSLRVNVNDGGVFGYPDEFQGPNARQSLAALDAIDAAADFIQRMYDQCKPLVPGPAPAAVEMRNVRAFVGRMLQMEPIAGDAQDETNSELVRALSRVTLQLEATTTFLREHSHLGIAHHCEKEAEFGRAVLAKAAPAPAADHAKQAFTA